MSVIYRTKEPIECIKGSSHRLTDRASDHQPITAQEVGRQWPITTQERDLPEKGWEIRTPPLDRHNPNPSLKGRHSI
ncbi:hypothetical protein AOLI_G00092060 [Acnodon oligacanthus]